MATPFDQLTDEEKQAKFRKWLESREARKESSTAKRKAIQALIKAHKAEYNKLVVANGGKVKE